MIRPLAITGMGAVSPAGWGVDPMLAHLAAGATPDLQPLPAPAGVDRVHLAAMVPPRRDPMAAHPRLRRAGRIAHFAAAAAMEALGEEKHQALRTGDLRLGIVFTLMNGGVAYSRRFFGEVVENPATASPILFPETVFNAPASHLAAYLDARGPVYTLVGGPAEFFAGVAMASLWLDLGLIDACLVVGAEECDWMTAEGLAMLAPRDQLSEGAGAWLLEPAGPSRHPRLTSSASPTLPVGLPTSLLVGDSTHPAPLAPAGWHGDTLFPLHGLGQSLGAACAWQSVLAARAVADGSHAAAVIAVTAPDGLPSCLVVQSDSRDDGINAT